MVSQEQLSKPLTSSQMSAKPKMYSSLTVTRKHASQDAWRELRHLDALMIIKRQSLGDSKPIIMILSQSKISMEDLERSDSLIQTEIHLRSMMIPEEQCFLRSLASLDQRHLERPPLELLSVRELTWSWSGSMTSSFRRISLTVTISPRLRL